MGGVGSSEGSVPEKRFLVALAEGELGGSSRRPCSISSERT